MYTQPQFHSTDRAIAWELIRSYPFASLISNTDSGAPLVTHLPLHLELRGESAVLLGHVAKANGHWRHLQLQSDALVTFMGPHAFMSPKVYPDLARVPTWNYLAVHVAAKATLIEDPAGKDRLLKKLIGDHDPAYSPQWRGLGEAYQHKMLAGIMAFELQVTDLQCTLKINQHRPEAHAAMHEAYSNGNENERAMAGWMERLGMVKSVGDEVS